MNAIVEQALLSKIRGLSEQQLAEVEVFIEALTTKALFVPEQVEGSYATLTNDPAFGIWRDRKDLKDVDGFVRELRASRFTADGSRDTH